MIIPDSFVQSYEPVRERWEPIKREADGIFQNTLIPMFPGAVYSSRIKGLESIYLKAQKENYQSPFEDIDDFFACQIIVLTLADIKNVKQEIQKYFVCEEVSSTKGDPTSFGYTDVRYSLKLPDSSLRMDKSSLNLKFEFQIKTFLQSAWQKTGHDIVYKAKIISYWNERIFSQVNALLELADNILAQIDLAAKILSDNSLYSDDGYKPEQKRILALLETSFNESELPVDRRRVALVIKKYIDLASINLDEFEKIIDDAKMDTHRIFEFLTLSPSEKIFILLFEKYSNVMLKKLNDNKNKNRALITLEMEEFYPSLKSIKDSGRCKI